MLLKITVKTNAAPIDISKGAAFSTHDILCLLNYVPIDHVSLVFDPFGETRTYPCIS